MLTKNGITAILVTVLVFFGTPQLMAQDGKSKRELRKEAKARKKAEKKIALAENLDQLKSLISDSTFTLEVNAIRNRFAYRNVLTPNSFIKVDRDKIIIQTTSPGRFGPNGLGGVTIGGRVLNYDIFEDKNGVRVNIQISSPVLGNSTVLLSTRADGSSSAYIRTNFGSQTTFIGNLIALDDRTQFEGNRLF